MPSLLDLPLEILTQIVQETIPQGFEAAALSCHSLFLASAPFRAQYATRKKRFKHFSFSKREDGAYWSDVTGETGIQIMNARQLLEHIAEDPSLVHYIHSLDLRGPHEDDAEDDELFNSLEVELPENVKQLVRTSPYIQAVGGDPEWWIGGVKFSMVDADVLLLTMLPQVRTLTLHRHWESLNPFNARNRSDVDHIWPVLKLITYRANHPEEFPDAPLSRLAVLEPHQEMDYEERCPLTPFAPFMAINSVSEVSLISCIFKDDGYTGLPFDPLMDSYSPNLRKLSLQCSVAGAEELAQLLSRIPNLEKFEFSSGMKWHGCGYSWNWGAFLDVVQETCAKKLQELSVTLLEHYGNPGATLMDMTRFERLSVLELDVAMLCGPPYDPSMRNLEWDDFKDQTRQAYPRLADLLPASIEEFSLRLSTPDQHYLQCISKVVDGLADARRTRLTKLWKLRLFVVPEILEQARQAMEVAEASGFHILDAYNDRPVLKNVP